MDLDLLRSFVTVTALIAFLGVVWWAYAPARRGHFERQARIPLDEEDGRP